MNIYSAILKIMSLTSSFVSLFKGAMGVFKHLPLIKINHQVKSMPHFTWKSNIVLFISFMMTILPRLLSISVFFACCDSVGGPMAFFVFSLVYFFTFLALTLPKYQLLKTDENCEEYFQNLVMAFFSSILRWVSSTPFGFFFCLPVLL